MLHHIHNYDVKSRIMMRGIDRISVKRFRCFREEQQADIRPITILNGENGTGKTSLLGSCLALEQILSGNSASFNEPPFQMGGFRDVLNGRGTQFNIGYDIVRAKKRCRVSFGLVNSPRSSCTDCRVSSVILSIGDSARINLDITEEDEIVATVPKAGNTKLTRVNQYVGLIDLASRLVFSLLVHSAEKRSGDVRLSERLVEMSSGLSRKDVLKLHGLLSAAGSIGGIEGFFGRIKARPKANYGSYKIIKQRIDDDFSVSHGKPGSRVIAFAPLTTKPNRVHGKLSGGILPESDDVPMFLRGLKLFDPKEWKRMRGFLARFGKDSGMYSDIDIKDCDGEYGMFELQAKVGPSMRSVVDVGYGVSQALQFLVEIHRRRNDACTYLMQQPEAFMHPKAQASFTSLMAQATNDTESTFIVETHSDSILDRLQILVRKGELSPDKVSVINFDRGAGGGVTIHNMKLGKQGNLVGAPKGYREFFLKEINTKLGFE